MGQGPLDRGGSDVVGRRFVGLDQAGATDERVLRSVRREVEVQVGMRSRKTNT
jgi:hypothetical protein